MGLIKCFQWLASCTLLASFSHVVKAERYLITLKDESLNANLLNSKINSVENFQIGDFSGYIITTDYTLEELKNIDFIEQAEVDEDIQLDPDIVENEQFNPEIDPDNRYQWGLDRIDQEDLPLDRKTFDPENDGDDIRIYIVDTGLRTTHNEFEGRAVKGYDFAYNDPDPNDRHGHGTHVASSATGKNVGVATGAIPVGVKVLSDSGSGSYSNVIKGVEWSVKNALDNGYCGIISMSLGGGKNTILNKAVDKAVEQGVHVVVAAGNDYGDACRKSPASAEKAITVGSTTISDSRSSFSNYGSCVDIYGPGSSIYGAWVNSDSSYRTISGTSMATPHVSGALAVYLKKYGCKADTNIFIENSYKDKIKNIPSGTVNKLLSVKMDNSPPTPSPTVQCPEPRAISHCYRKPDGKLRTKNDCKGKWWRNDCTWCNNGRRCQPKGMCSATNPFKDCPGLPTASPTSRPTRPVPTMRPTRSPTPRPTPPTSAPTDGPTMSPIPPTSAPTKKCPGRWAVSYCYRRPTGQKRVKWRCNNQKQRCDWCGSSGCHPNGFCDDPDAYKDCPGYEPTPTPRPTRASNETARPTRMPTPRPTTPVTQSPTSSRKSIDLIWKGISTGLNFELNATTGFINIDRVSITYNRKSAIHTWKNSMVKENDIVLLDVHEYKNGHGIPDVILQSVSDGEIKFTLANSDGNNRITNMNIEISFVIM